MTDNYNARCDWCGRPMTWNQKKYFSGAKKFCCEKCRSEYLATQERSAASASSSARKGSSLKKAMALLVFLLGLFLIAYTVLNRSGQKSQDSAAPEPVETIPQEQNKQGDFHQEDTPVLVREEMDDEEAPESLWTRNFYSGTLSGGGKTYEITMAISYPGEGSFNCPIIGSYQYKGHNDSIVLEGDWIELKDLYMQLPVLYSDEYLERFDLEMNGEDLISSTVLKGTWSKYGNKSDYDNADKPKKSLDVVLNLQQ